MLAELFPQGNVLVRGFCFAFCLLVLAPWLKSLYAGPQSSPRLPSPNFLRFFLYFY